MRPLARTRLAWWDNLRAVMVLVGVVVALVAAVAVLQWAGAAVARIGVVAVVCAFAWTTQSRRLSTFHWIAAVVIAGFAHG